MKKRHPNKSNILLVNITRLGDMLQATPTIAGMKMENPDCKITVLVEKQFEAVCHTIPNIDEVLSLDLAMTCRSIAAEGAGLIDAFDYVSEMVEILRSKNFDYCLNMSSSAYTALLLSLLGIKRNGGWTADEEGYRVIESDWARLFATSVFHQNRQFNSLNLVDVFRCSADVEKHPEQLLISVDQKDLKFCEELIANANFTNTGPLVAIQAGASQGKRQWAPKNFIELIKILVNKHNCRVVLTGAGKEIAITEPIALGVDSPNVLHLTGKTSIPQLTAMLKLADILVTGDTGPMHIAVAAGTPVIAMFLASAFGFETGPYSAGNIIIQPVIGCGPCNPNKPCARPDCHETFTPEELAMLTMLRLEGDFTELPKELADHRGAVIYRSCFDEFGFCDLVALTSGYEDPLKAYREAYRKMWLSDIGGFPVAEPQKRTLSIVNKALDGLEDVIKAAKEGEFLIQKLVRLVKDTKAPAAELGKTNDQLTELDRQIEQLGFHHNHLGPVTRMFIFAKENIVGTEALDLASQMEKVYQDLGRRCEKLGHYYQVQ